jgi:hypothetical protein
MQVPKRAHRHNPVFLDAYVCSFEHRTPLVHRNQPRIGKNETHRESPSRFGVHLSRNTGEQCSTEAFRFAKMRLGFCWLTEKT